MDFGSRALVARDYQARSYTQAGAYHQVGQHAVGSGQYFLGTTFTSSGDFCVQWGRRLFLRFFRRVFRGYQGMGYSFVRSYYVMAYAGVWYVPYFYIRVVCKVVFFTNGSGRPMAYNGN